MASVKIFWDANGVELDAREVWSLRRSGGGSAPDIRWRVPGGKVHAKEKEEPGRPSRVRVVGEGTFADMSVEKSD